MTLGNDAYKSIIMSDPDPDKYDKLLLLGYIVLMLIVTFMKKLKMFTVMITMMWECWQQQW